MAMAKTPRAGLFQNLRIHHFIVIHPLIHTHTHTHARASWTWVSIGVELSSEQIGAWGVFLPHTRYLFLVNFSVCRGIPLHVGVLVILTAWEWNCHEGRDLNVERERQARMHGDQSIICVEFG